MKQGDTVVGFLSVECDLITQGIDLRFRKLGIRYFSFLKTYKVRVVLGNNSLKLVEANSDTVDIKRDNFDSGYLNVVPGVPGC